jgi:O-antigen/teichoic acid export membrane protein
MAATLAVGFFLAPFVVHKLGNLAYGVWILAVSALNYMNLLDLGMRSSVLRYVSKGHTTEDHCGASEVLSAALWVRLQIGFIVILLCGIFSAVFPKLFRVPPALARDAQEAILIVGVTMAVTMSIGLLGAVLSALNRYDLQTLVTLTQLTIRVVGVVLVLRAGKGIVAIAACELLAAVVANGLLIYVARRIYPELTIRLATPRREVLRKIWSYSFYAFLLTVAGQLGYETDNLVVGAFVSASAVTFYSIGNSLCRYTQQIVGAMTSTFTSVASTYEAAGQPSTLRSLYYNGTRATMALSLPVVITLLTRGRNFISVWMGPQYAQTSGTVLVILATALLFNLQNAPAGAIAWGIEKHKTVAKWAMPEALANFALSIILGRKFGIYGVAIGTLVPNLVTAQILWPRYVSRLVEVTYAEVVLKVWGPVYLSAVPYAIASYATGRFFPARNITVFILQTIVLLPVFGLTLTVAFWDQVRRQVFPRVRTIFYADAK